MYARVARWEGGEAEGLRASAEQTAQRVSSGEGPPEGVPAVGFTMLVDAEGGRTIAISLFETEEDLRKGDEALNTMTPQRDDVGQRVSVETYEVAADSGLAAGERRQQLVRERPARRRAVDQAVPVHEAREAHPLAGVHEAERLTRLRHEVGQRDLHHRALELRIEVAVRLEQRVEAARRGRVPARASPARAALRKLVTVSGRSRTVSSLTATTSSS